MVGSGYLLCKSSISSEGETPALKRTYLCNFEDTGDIDRLVYVDTLSGMIMEGRLEIFGGGERICLNLEKICRLC
ncbi:MAG: hypothetical protein ACP5E4_04880 [Candidatus Aenigmatarchaeota archaeon]